MFLVGYRSYLEEWLHLCTRECMKQRLNQILSESDEYLIFFHCTTKIGDEVLPVPRTGNIVTY